MGGELVYSATLFSEGLAVAAHRFNRVIIRGSRCKICHKHAVDHMREILVPTVKRFCLVTQVLWIRSVVHHRVLNRAAASVGRPSDNGGIIRRRFQFWSFYNVI